MLLVQLVLNHTDYQMSSHDVNAVMGIVGPIEEHIPFINLLLDRQAPLTMN